MIIHRCSRCSKELPYAWPHYTVLVKRTEQGFSIENQKTIHEYELCKSCTDELLRLIEGFDELIW